MAVQHTTTTTTIPSPIEPDRLVARTPQQEVVHETSGNEGLKDIAFGSIAGSVGKVVEYPFDTVKVRLQSQPDHLPLRYTGPLDCFRQSMQADGVRSLYRGLSAPLFGAAAETACLFWTYGLAQEVLRNVWSTREAKETLPLTALVTAGAMAGGLTSLVLTPIELVKCRMQVPLSSSVDLTLSSRGGLATKSLSPIAVIREVYVREGLAGFWRGQMGTFLRETGGTAAWFGSYEAATLYFKTARGRELATQPPATGTPLSTAVSDIELPLSEQMMAGAIAGMAYNFLFFPADTIKSKIQTGELTNVRPTFLNVGRELYRAHGVKGLYRGCGITVARSAPSSALIFTIVENLKKTFA